MKIGTRVEIDGIETYVTEIHKDIFRGVYKIKTDNPSYEFLKNPSGEWWSGDSLNPIWLKKAKKFSNYKKGDRVKSIDPKRYRELHKIGIITSICYSTLEETKGEIFQIIVTWDTDCIPAKYIKTTMYNGDGTEWQMFFPQKNPSLKRIRVKI